MSVPSGNLKRHKRNDDKLSRCKVPRHINKVRLRKIEIETEKILSTDSPHNYGSSRHSADVNKLVQHSNLCEKEFIISNYFCLNNNSDVHHPSNDHAEHYLDINDYKKSGNERLPPFQDTYLMISSHPKCPDCAAGKSGHIQHIKQWQSMDQS